MAVDKLVDSTQLNSDLTSIANAIRTKGGISAQLAFPSGFVTAIENIETGDGQPTEVIVPEQSITTSNESTRIPNFNTGLIAGEQYIFTINNERITATASTQGSSVLLFYDSNLAAEYINNLMYFDVLSSSLYDTYTIKVERILTDCDYIREVIIPLQTVTPNSTDYFATLTNYTGGFEDGECYIVTVDGTEWFTTSSPIWDNEHTLGDPNWFLGTPVNYTYPFGINYGIDNGETVIFYSSQDTIQHTIKIEKITLLTRGTELTTKTITSNGTYSASNDNVDGYSEVTVNVSAPTPSLQAKTNINPTTSSQTITADSGYDGLSSVQINAMPSGSTSGPSTVSGTSATVSAGTNTLTLTKTVSITPTVSAGYVSAGTATNATVTLTGSVTTKAAATITPGTSNQTIASGTYLTGAQTIAGDADLVASNIISTANIFGVQGSVVINKYYTGSSAPSSSLGNNGDIYLQA